MEFSEKMLVYQAAHGFFEDEAPDQVEEFELVFDSVYRTIERRMEEIAGGDKSGTDIIEDGLGFDTSIAIGTMISTVTWIVLALARAALRDALKRDLPLLLDKVQERLTLWTGKPEVVAKLRDRIQGILQEL